MHRMIPLGNILKQRNPKAYRNMKCQFCMTEEEDWAHIFICQHMNDIWDEIYEKNVNSITSTIKDNMTKDEPLTDNEIEQCTTSMIGTSHRSPKFKTNMMMISEVKIRQSTFEELCKNLKVSKEKARKIACIIMVECIRNFKETYWKEKCDRVLRWESQNNIRAKDKKYKAIRKAKLVKKQLEHEEDDTICFDDPPIPGPKKPPKYTAQIRFLDALPIIYKQMLRYIKDNARTTWVYHKKDCFNTWLRVDTMGNS